MDVQQGIGPPRLPSTTMSRSLWGVFFTDTFGAAASGLFIFVYSIYIIQLGGDGVDVGIIFSVSLAVSAVSYLPGAYLVHLFDRKKIMIASMLVPPVALVILYYATSWTHVLIAESIWFIGNFGSPAFITYITEASPKNLVMRRFGIVYAGPALAYVVAPGVGALIILQYGEIRNIFPFALALRLIAPLFLLTIDSQLPKPSLFSKSRLTKQLFSFNRQTLVRILFLVLIGAVLSMCVPYLPLFLIDLRGFSEMQVQILGSIGYLGAAILSIGLGHLGDSRGGAIGVFATLAVFIAGCMLLLGADFIGTVLLAVFMLGIMTAVITILDSIAGLKSDQENIGGQLSIYLLAESIAMAPMPFLGGLLYDRVGKEWPFIVGAVLASVLLVMVFLRRDLLDTTPSKAH